MVLNSFQVKFPNAEDVSWKLEDGNYQVKYKVNSKPNEVTLDYKGGVLKHQQDLYANEIPKPVLQTIESKEPIFDIGDAKKTVENGQTLYEIVFRINGKRRFFWINEKAQLVKYRKELYDAEVPAPIMSFINSKYGPFERLNRAKYVEENGKVYYIVAGRAHVFLFDDKVNLLQHNQDLQESKIPVAIKQTIQESYKGYEITDADMVEKRGVATYTLRMRKSGKDIYVTFTPEGQILHTQ